jgi:hypothetical protein
MSLPINPGDTVNFATGPHMTPTTATVTAVDNLRRIVMLNHLTGPLVGKPSGQVHMDHVRQPSESFAPMVRDGKVWS